MNIQKIHVLIISIFLYIHLNPCYIEQQSSHWRSHQQIKWDECFEAWTRLNIQKYENALAGVLTVVSGYHRSILHNLACNKFQDAVVRYIGYES